MSRMKIAQLPPVRVTPAARAHIESVLHEGESLSQFVEKATLDAANRRKAQQEFIARGRASLANAERRANCTLLVTCSMPCATG
jgi:hypothetical protein